MSRSFSFSFRNLLWITFGRLFGLSTLNELRFVIYDGVFARAVEVLLEAGEPADAGEGTFDDCGNHMTYEYHAVRDRGQVVCCTQRRDMRLYYSMRGVREFAK